MTIGYYMVMDDDFQRLTQNGECRKQMFFEAFAYGNTPIIDKDLISLDIYFIYFIKTDDIISVNADKNLRRNNVCCLCQRNFCGVFTFCSLKS